MGNCLQTQGSTARHHLFQNRQKNSMQEMGSEERKDLCLLQGLYCNLQSTRTGALSIAHPTKFRRTTHMPHATCGANSSSGRTAPRPSQTDGEQSGGRTSPVRNRAASRRQWQHHHPQKPSQVRPIPRSRPKRGVRISAPTRPRSHTSIPIVCALQPGYHLSSA